MSERLFAHNVIGGPEMTRQLRVISLTIVLCLATAPSLAGTPDEIRDRLFFEESSSFASSFDRALAAFEEGDMESFWERRERSFGAVLRDERYAREHPALREAAEYLDALDRPTTLTADSPAVDVEELVSTGAVVLDDDLVREIRRWQWSSLSGSLHRLCSQPLDALALTARGCDRLGCLELVLHAAQIEASCEEGRLLTCELMPPNGRNQGACDGPFTGASTAATRVAIAKMRDDLRHTDRCQERDVLPVRCLGASREYDDYLHLLKAADAVSIAIPGLLPIGPEVIKNEVERLQSTATDLLVDCRDVPAVPVEQPERFLSMHGCSASNLPSLEWQQVESEYRAVWEHQLALDAQQAEHEARLRDQAEVEAETRREAELAHEREAQAELERERRAAYEAIKRKKEASPECALAKTTSTYCMAAAEHRTAQEQLRQMDRLDLASGTVDPAGRRDLGRRLILAEDVLALESEKFTDLVGMAPPSSLCASELADLQQQVELACLP
jgi:hypothetical protein